MTEETVYLIFIYVLTGVLGLCVGSFLNVVIHRVPLGMSVAYPPSHCPKCGMRLKWCDNIPVFSWCALRGRCRGCGAPISVRYTVVEIANALLWLCAVWRFFSAEPWALIRTACMMALSSVLLCVFFIDWEHQIIPDRFSVVIAVLGVIVTISDAFLVHDAPWADHLIGLAAGGGFFLLFYGLSFLIYKREGLGFGDVKLMAAAGLYLGFANTFFAVLIGSVTGSVILLILRSRTKSDRFTEYPFAPFLTAGILAAAFFGDIVTDWYVRLLTF